jgi:hypothetical protein
VNDAQPATKNGNQTLKTNQIANIRTDRAASGFSFMKVKSSVAMSQLVAAGLLLLFTGCKTVEKHSLTYRLWDNGDLRRWSEPAPNPNLAIFEATNGADLLVQYDALSEKHSAVKRRAYYLLRNEARIDAGKKPKLVSLAVAEGMKSIAVLPTQVAVNNLPPAPTAYAVVTNVGRGFTLYRSPQAAATFNLPVYAETSGTPTRIVLTPFAVAGDIVVVGVVVAVVGFYSWAQSGGPTY